MNPCGKNSAGSHYDLGGPSVIHLLKNDKRSSKSSYQAASGFRLGYFFHANGISPINIDIYMASRAGENTCSPWSANIKSFSVTRMILSKRLNWSTSCSTNTPSALRLSVPSVGLNVSA